jgi:predicted pyridoxine 5'-phosphate oxidase superfamily flavin-nucleotide-binding protein
MSWTKAKNNPQLPAPAINDEAKRIIRDFSLGIVATVTADGTPAASPKGTFLVVDDTTIAYGDIRSPGTRANLEADTRCEVVFVDPFRRKGFRLRGNAVVQPKDSDRFQELIGRWYDTWGALVDRVTALVIIDVDRVLPLATPPYDDGVTEEEMIALYRDKYAAIYPASGE